MSHHALITAGATRNPVDAMRFISAYSSGRTGVALAEALSDTFAVRLLGSPEALLRAEGSPAGASPMEREAYSTTRDLMARVQRFAEAHPDGLIIHAAAVGDYEAEPNPGKLPSGQEELLIRLRRAPKILDAVRGWGFTGPLVSFKAAGPETTPEDLVRVCEAQLHRTGSDLVFGNVIGALGETAVLVSAREAKPYEDRAAAISALAAWARATQPSLR